MPLTLSPSADHDPENAQISVPNDSSGQWLCHLANKLEGSFKQRSILYLPGPYVHTSILIYTWHILRNADPVY